MTFISNKLFHFRVCLSLLIGLVLYIPGQAYSLEIYTLVGDNCGTETGLIVGGDERRIYMLNVDGRLSSIGQDDVRLILVYNIHDNPIPMVDLNSELGSLLREVELSDVEKTNFIGWPIKFIDQVIIFFDIDGKTHLVDLEKIKNFSAPEQPFNKRKEISNAKPTQFGLGNSLSQCKKKDAEDGVKMVEPTRMLGDRIKVDKFFSEYERGFTALRRFQKKTVFYSKPFLYEKRSRVGIIYTREDYLREITPSLIPFRFQWSSGSPFASQGVYSVGAKEPDYVASVEPQFVLDAKVKTHFMSAAFIGNVFCFSAGNACVMDRRSLYANYFSKLSSDSNEIYPLFNYLALTGLDYKEYSIAGGFYYPVFGIIGGHRFREITSSQASPILKFQRTTPESMIRLTYSQTTRKSNSPKDDQEIQLIYSRELSDAAQITSESASLIDNMLDYFLTTHHYRMKLNFKILDGIDFGINEILFHGKYAETQGGERYLMEFRHVISSMVVKKQFSDYIALTGQLNHFLRTHDYEVINLNETSNNQDKENNVSFSLTIEFLL
ncbi:MAG: hypothetical protein EVA81_03110 [Proteobacteria bacterium]|nr:MAG: hypothetical protein EVA81_03110 [Pseudomonadota bacterium]